MKNVMVFLATVLFAGFVSAASLVGAGAGTGSVSQAGAGGFSGSAGGGLSGTVVGVQTVSGGEAGARSTRRGVKAYQTSGTSTQGGSLSGSYGNAAAGSGFLGGGSAGSVAGGVRFGR